MKVAYVVPRYGAEVVGGAEYAARMLAERLVADCGWHIDVLTTCAVDAATWEDVYPPGEEHMGGVRVRRYRSVAGRAPNFDAYSEALLGHAPDATPDEEWRWIELQGPVCPEVVDAAAASDADVVAFLPYLYYPTIRGIDAVGARAAMHPAAHDERPIRLPLFDGVFNSAGALAFFTHGERRLVERLFSVAHIPQVVIGLGCEPASGEATTARAALGLGDEPYLLCLGRVDEGKGSLLLARFFRAYKARHPGPLKLVYAGPVVHRPPAHPDIVVAGRVQEDTKWGALRGALALVSPSPFESFSIVLVEAWTAGIPAIVNARCLATREQVLRSGGGLLFGGYAQFEVAVERLMADARLARTLAARGRAYVDRHLTWPRIIERYAAFLEAAADRAAG